jgi:hypothetical protein
MKRFITTIAVSLILVMGMVAPALAVNNTAANAQELFLGQAFWQGIPAATGYWYKANLTAGRSYCVYTWSPWADPSVSALSLDMAVYRNDGVTLASDVYSTDIEPRVENTGPGGNNGEQRRIIPSVNDSYRIRVINNAALAHSVYVMVVETTLFAPWFFVSPGAGYDGYIEMRNNTINTLTAVVTAFDPAGGVFGSATIDLPANGNAVITATSLGVISSYGSVQIAHNGGPGAICANITTLSSITGLSFDSPFTPRMVWSTFGGY